MTIDGQESDGERANVRGLFWRYEINLTHHDAAFRQIGLST